LFIGLLQITNVEKYNDYEKQFVVTTSVFVVVVVVSYLLCFNFIIITFTHVYTLWATSPHSPTCFVVTILNCAKAPTILSATVLVASRQLSIQ
jgi:hypothetical protein